MNKKTVGIYTLGCRLNIYESDGILNQFISDGYKPVNWEEGPDIAIINTCTVTSQADAKNRNIIRNILKKNPNAKVIVTGCYAQTDKEELEKISGIFAIVGNQHKSKIFEIYRNLEKNQFNQAINLSEGPLKYFENSKKRRIVNDPFEYGNVVPIGHTRAYLKIQDGCDRKCSYCKIPMARGGGISRPIEDILKQIEILEENKIPEIVLTGVNLGWYRYKNYRFCDLLEKILEKLKYSRLRISSIEPSDVNERLAELTLHPKFCNFLHVPLQSGSDRILRLMKRSYNSKTFSLRIEKVLKINPEIFLGTDIIVGFPGETSKDFKDTIKLLKNLNFVNIHAFPFSVRKGTEIESYIKQNPEKVIKKDIIKKRVKLLIKLKNQLLYHYAKSRINKTFIGIIEKIEDHYIEVLTDNYLNIRIFPSNPEVTL
ncbi:MAG: tRNA (N(6)-L-threonylcarbamoyladenosine(37)-C(2))-methylthiotransferase MtaB [Leptospiraceae bacterium]|nr:MAG: tRNA (N(6)-L-threonylcarbamoyladenosine(37)-C(2))-methylthiotransferase MtaB [Leptospiraceae bacterium]